MANDLDIKLGIDTALRQIKDLTKKVEDLGEVFSSLQQKTNLDIADNFRQIDASLKPLTKTVNKLGNSFRLVSTYAGSAKDAFDGLARSGSLANTLRSLGNSLKDLDLSTLDYVSKPLNRLGNSFKNISIHAEPALENIKLLTRGGSLSSSGTKISSLASQMDLFSKSLSAFSGKEFKTSGLSNIINVLSKLRYALRMPDTSTSYAGLNKLASMITIVINRLNAVASTPAFAGFSRLADATYKLSLGAKALVGNVDKAEKTIKKLGETSTKTTQSINWLAGGWKSVVTAFAGGTVIYTVVRAIQDAVKAFLDFDKQLRLINSLTQDTETNMKAVGKTILAVSSYFGVPIDRASQAMFNITSATYRGADALRVFKAASMLAVAGNADMVSSADVVARTILAYGKSTTEVGRVTDLLFKTQDRGIISISGLANNLGKVTPAAAAANVSLEDLSASIATLTAKGMQGTIATTSLNSVLLKLSAGTENLDKLFNKLGYDSVSVALSQKGLGYVMRQIQAATGGISYELQRLGFNYRDIKAAAILANDQNMMFANNLKYMNEEAEDGARTLEAYKEISKSVAQTIAELTESFKSGIISLSQFISKWSGLKAVLGFVNYLTKLEAGFGSLLGIIKMIVSPAFKIVAVLAITSATIITVVGALSKLKTALIAVMQVGFWQKLTAASTDANVFKQGLMSLTSTFNNLRTTIFATKAAFISFAIATIAYTAMITAGLALISLAITKISEALSNAKADKYVANSAQAVDKLSKGISELKSVALIERRLTFFNNELERTDKLANTPAMNKYRKQLQANIQVLNNLKSSLGGATISMAAMDKYNKAIEDYNKSNRGDYANIAYLVEQRDLLLESASYVNKNTSAWVNLQTKIVEVTKDLKNATQEMKGQLGYITKIAQTERARKAGGGTGAELQAQMKMAEERIRVLQSKMGISQTSLGSIKFTKEQLERAASGDKGLQGVINEIASAQYQQAKPAANVIPSLQNMVTKDLQTLGIDSSKFDLSNLKRSLPEIGNALAALDTSINDVRELALKGVDTADIQLAKNEAILESEKKKLQILEMLVGNTKNATVEQKKLLEAQKNRVDAVAKETDAFKEYQSSYDNIFKKGNNRDTVFKALRDFAMERFGTYSKEAWMADTQLRVGSTEDFIKKARELFSSWMQFSGGVFNKAALPTLNTTASGVRAVTSSQKNALDQQKEYEKNLKDLTKASAEYQAWLKKIADEYTKSSFAMANIFRTFNYSAGTKYSASPAQVINDAVDKLPKASVDMLKNTIAGIRTATETSSGFSAKGTRDFIAQQRASLLAKGGEDLAKAFDTVVQSLIANRDLLKSSEDYLRDLNISLTNNPALKFAKYQQQYNEAQADYATAMQENNPAMLFEASKKMIEALQAKITLTSEIANRQMNQNVVSEQTKVGSREAYIAIANQANKNYQSRMMNYVGTLAQQAIQIARNTNRTAKQMSNAGEAGVITSIVN